MIPHAILDALGLLCAAGCVLLAYTLHDTREVARGWEVNARRERGYCASLEQQVAQWMNRAYAAGYSPTLRDPNAVLRGIYSTPGKPSPIAVTISELENSAFNDSYAAGEVLHLLIGGEECE